ncbi:peptidoglycan editing factor PgeF [Vampirovibrio chlorellavorus]|uniref:peptidoglycan editing factor PgeF n=1 Tax=Vampirovibrio chlorellavorus TaxID=758823 RepID=UPI0026EFAB35|nr:peptidoglycan editing factor PgeF [Vampirovibrio chlorellavorus]
MPKTAVPVITEPFVLYQSALLNTYTERVIHGFTGKPITLGGQACPPAQARANRELVCEHTGLSVARLTLPRQTHTDQFRLNDIPCDRETDAVILTETGVAAMVQVADCVPIILYEPDRHIGAVIHAGWRGTAQSITAKVAQILISQYQASPHRLLAVIGPSIGGCCYEVSPEVAEQVGQSLPQVTARQYTSLSLNGKPQIDLKQVNALQLQTLGISQIDSLPACTLCEPERLWSHRRGETGRQVALLELKPLSAL